MMVTRVGQCHEPLGTVEATERRRLEVSDTAHMSTAVIRPLGACAGAGPRLGDLTFVIGRHCEPVSREADWARLLRSVGRSGAGAHLVLKQHLEEDPPPACWG